MINIAFLFGAGTEYKGNYNMPSGFEYMKDILFHDNISGFIEALKDYFKVKKYFNNSYSYRIDTYSDIEMRFLKNMIISKLERDKEILIKNHKAELTQLFTRDEISELIRENLLTEDCDKSDEKKDEKITEEVKKILKNETKQYNEIGSGLLKDLFDDNDNQISFDMPVAISNFFDKDFHTIINPKKYGTVRFSRVFNYYWACFFTILRSVLISLKDKMDIDPYIQDEKLNFEAVLNNLQNLIKIIYETDLGNSEPKTYYDYIKKMLEENQQIKCAGIATSNYFRFCEVIDNKNVAYLNGQLRLFEYPELLEVRDFTQELTNTSDALFFPFIFGQSLVKPLVHEAQIKQFSRFNDILNDAELLIVLGYNINEDDNHINSFLHSFCSNEKKRLLFVSDQEENKMKEQLLEKLRFSVDDEVATKTIKILKVNYNDENKKIIADIEREILNISSKQN